MLPCSSYVVYCKVLSLTCPSIEDLCCCLFSQDYGGFESTHLNCLNVVELSEPGSKYRKLWVVLAKLAKAQSYEGIEHGSLGSIPVYKVLSTPPVTFVNPPGTDNVGTQVRLLADAVL